MFREVYKMIRGSLPSTLKLVPDIETTTMGNIPGGAIKCDPIDAGNAKGCPVDHGGSTSKAAECPVDHNKASKSIPGLADMMRSGAG